jgi:hypothetical protein
MIFLLIYIQIYVYVYVYMYITMIQKKVMNHYNTQIQHKDVIIHSIYILPFHKRGPVHFPLQIHGCNLPILHRLSGHRTMVRRIPGFDKQINFGRSKKFVIFINRFILNQPPTKFFLITIFDITFVCKIIPRCIQIGP